MDSEGYTIDKTTHLLPSLAKGQKQSLDKIKENMKTNFHRNDIKSYDLHNYGKNKIKYRLSREVRITLEELSMMTYRVG